MIFFGRTIPKCQTRKVVTNNTAPGAVWTDKEKNRFFDVTIEGQGLCVLKKCCCSMCRLHQRIKSFFRKFSGDGEMERNFIPGSSCKVNGVKKLIKKFNIASSFSMISCNYYLKLIL